ncbi:M18 family aminopeptidase [Candidatus Electronema sp. PJ]|uniref:M18 family aminopeptidase n=1 Tax=Candidatus Electronema sp. PJ TaxID=3401572 RepID=UPI003AA7AC65
MLPYDTCLADLISFLHSSPTAFHAAANAAALLTKQGFVQLHEQENWPDLPAGKYFVLRNDSSLIGFTWQGGQTKSGFRMIGAHTDSPGLKVKPNPLRKEQNCLQLGVEIYGGALLRPWFDRELSLAGRIFWQDADSRLHSALLDFQRPVGIIPNLAIHLNREANKQQEINTQTDMVPLIGLADDNKVDFQQLLREQLHRQYPEAVPAGFIDHELYFYDANPPSLVGLNSELITGARLDNLVSCFAALQALLNAAVDENCLIVLYDHEEVGSTSAVGAQGPFLRDILERLLPNSEARQTALRSSFLISADNAHAVHPNYAAKHDPQHLPYLGKGPVIKFNANQRYATNAASAARFRQLCTLAGVPVQEFVSRSDMACGSTIGPLTAAGIGIETVDVGIPSLAMHSIRETAACIDCWHLCRVLLCFFQ